MAAADGVNSQYCINLHLTTLIKFACYSESLLHAFKLCHETRGRPRRTGPDGRRYLRRRRLP